MADYKDLCHTPGSQKWLKCWMAVYITRGGILPFVREQMTDLHKAFLDTIEKEGLPTCSSCCIPNIFNCPTNGLCYVKKGHCNLHSAPELMYKFCKAHDKFKTEIKKNQNRLKPFWTNSKAEKWFSSPLELAKCFLPKGEYSEKESFDELDFNGLLALLINCKTFEPLFQANMSDQTNVCTEVRDLVNKIRHFERIDIPITDVELQDTIDKMIRLLSDSKHLLNREGVLRDLKQLKGDTLVISTRDDAIKCLEEAYKSIDEIKSKALENIKKDITENLEAAKDEVESITDKSLNKVREERDTSIAAIEEQRKQAVADIEKRLKDQDERDQLSETSFKDQTDSLEAFAHVQEHKLERIVHNIKRETKEARTRSMYTPEEQIHKEFQLELIKYQERKHGYLQQVALLPDIKVPIDSLYVNPDVAIETDFDNKESHSGNESREVESFRNMLFKEGYASNKECDITEMITSQIVSELPGRNIYSSDVVDTILTSKRTLVIMDALDEWNHPDSCRRQKTTIPHYIEGENLTVLITTRPLKAPIMSKFSPVSNVRLTLKGISSVSVRDLIYNVTKLLNTSHTEKAKDASDFLDMIFEVEMFAHLSVPLLGVFIISLWYDNRSLADSRCEIYAEILDMLILRDQEKLNTNPDLKGPIDSQNFDMVSCLKNKSGLALNFDTLESFAKLAFYTLTDLKRDSVVYFPEYIVAKYLSNTECKLALKMGILSCNTHVINLRKKEKRFYFAHKSFQEFLAALFIALDSDDSKSVDEIVSVCHAVEDILSFGDMFVFLCGLSQLSACKMLDKFNTILRIFHLDVESFDIDIIQRFVIYGYIEGKCNHVGFSLPLLNICVGRFMTEKEERNLIELIQRNKLDLEYISISCMDKIRYFATEASLQPSNQTENESQSLIILEGQHLKVFELTDYYTGPAICLELSKCSNLESIHIEGMHQCCLKINCKLVKKLSVDLELLSTLPETLFKDLNNLETFKGINALGKYPRFLAGFSSERIKCIKLVSIVFDDCIDLQSSANIEILSIINCRSTGLKFNSSNIVNFTLGKTSSEITRDALLCLNNNCEKLETFGVFESDFELLIEAVIIIGSIALKQVAINSIIAWPESLKISFICETIDSLMCDLSLVEKIDCIKKSLKVQVTGDIEVDCTTTALKYLLTQGQMIISLILDFSSRVLIDSLISCRLPQLRNLKVYNCSCFLFFCRTSQTLEEKSKRSLKGFVNFENLTKLKVIDSSAKIEGTTIEAYKLKILKIQNSDIFQPGIYNMLQLISTTLSEIDLDRVQLNNGFDLSKCVSIRELRLKKVSCKDIRIEPLELTKCYIEDCQESVVVKILSEPVSCANKLEELHISNSKTFNISINIVGKWPCLKSLKLRCLAVKGSISLLQCHSLYTVDLFDVSFHELRIIQCEGLSKLIVHNESNIMSCKQNTRLCNISMQLDTNSLREICIKNIESSFLQKLFVELGKTYLNTVQKLFLSGIQTFESRIIHHATVSTILNCPKLREFTLYYLNCEINISIENCFGLSILKLHRVCINSITFEVSGLKRCSLSQCSTPIVNSIVTEIDRHNTLNLEHLSISGCYKFELNNRTALYATLKELHLSSMTLKNCSLIIHGQSLKEVCIHNVKGDIRITNASKIDDLDLVKTAVFIEGAIRTPINLTVCHAPNLDVSSILLLEPTVLSTLILEGCSISFSGKKVFNCPVLESISMIAVTIMAEVVFRVDILRNVYLKQSKILHFELLASEKPTTFITDKCICDSIISENVLLKECSVSFSSTCFLAGVLSCLKSASYALQSLKFLPNDQNDLQSIDMDEMLETDIIIDSNELHTFELNGVSVSGEMTVCSSRLTRITLTNVKINGTIDIRSLPALTDLKFNHVMAGHILLKKDPMQTFTVLNSNYAIATAFLHYFAQDIPDIANSTDIKRQTDVQTNPNTSEISCTSNAFLPNDGWWNVEIKNLKIAEQLVLNLNVKYIRLDCVTINGSLIFSSSLEDISLHQVTISDTIDMNLCCNLKDLSMHNCEFGETITCDNMSLCSVLLQDIRGKQISTLQTNCTNLQFVHLIHNQIKTNCSFILPNVRQMLVAEMHFEGSFDVAFGKEIKHVRITDSHLYGLHFQPSLKQLQSIHTLNGIDLFEKSVPGKDIRLYGDTEWFEIADSTICGNATIISDHVEDFDFRKTILSGVLDLKECKSLKKLHLSIVEGNTLPGFKIETPNLLEFSISFENCEVLYNTLRTVLQTNNTMRMKITTAYAGNKHSCVHCNTDLSVSFNNLEIIHLSWFKFCGRLELTETTLKEICIVFSYLSSLTLSTNSVETCIVQDVNKGIIFGILSSLSRNAGKLQKLELKNCQRIEENEKIEKLIDIFELVCPALERFNFVGIHLNGRLSLCAEHLTVLIIELVIVSGCFDIQLCKNLRHLKIFSCVFDKFLMNADCLEDCSITGNTSEAIAVGVYKSFKNSSLVLKTLDVINLNCVQVSLLKIFGRNLEKVCLTHLKSSESISFVVSDKLVNVQLNNVEASSIHFDIAKVTPLYVRGPTSGSLTTLTYLGLRNVCIKGCIDLKAIKELQHISFNTVQCSDIALCLEQVKTCYISKVSPPLARTIVTELLRGACNIESIDTRECGLSRCLQRVIDCWVVLKNPLIDIFTKEESYRKIYKPLSYLQLETKWFESKYAHTLIQSYQLRKCKSLPLVKACMYEFTCLPFLPLRDDFKSGNFIGYPNVRLSTPSVMKYAPYF